MNTIVHAELITFFVLLVIGVGLQVAAAQLAKQKNRQKFPDEEDDTPSTITTRGAWLQTLWGQHRVAPVVGWVGNRRERHIRRSLPDIIEDAWHLLNVGKCNALTAIWKDGRILFQGRVTPETTPSGSTLSVTVDSITWQFRIYWGEDDQPIDPTIEEQVGISSRWPGICHIVVFNQKIGVKGQATAWPSLEYELTSRPVDSDLAIKRWFFNSDEVTALDPNPIFRVTNGEPGIGFIEVPQNLTSDYFPGVIADVTGQPLSTVTVRKTEFIRDVIQSNPSSDLTTWTNEPDKTGDPQSYVRNAILANPQLPGPPGVTEIQYILLSRHAKDSDENGGYTKDNVDLFQEAGLKATFSIVIFRGKQDSPLGDFIAEHMRLSILDSTNNKELVRGDFRYNHHAFVYQIDKLLSPAGKIKIDSIERILDVRWQRIGVSIEVEASEVGNTRKVLIRPANFETVNGRIYTKLRATPVIAPIAGQENTTKIFVNETLTGWSDLTGTITPQTPTTAPFNGANAAAIIDEVLFLESPRGAGLDKTIFDRTSLVTIGTSLDTTEERATCHAIARGGADAREIISDIMNDYGIVIAWDYSLGKFIFRLNRKAPASSTHIPTSLLEGIPPLLITSLLSKFTPKVVYTFRDRERNFTTSTISVDDDGQVLAIANQRAQKVSLKTITDFTSAGLISNRKDLENPSNASGVELTASRAARYLLPGDTLSVEGLPDLILISSTTPKSASSQVEIAGLFSVYGENAVPLPVLKGGGISIVQLATDDVQSDIIELSYPIVPRFSQLTVAIPRIRAHPGIISANILISENDIDYKSIQFLDKVTIGGTLVNNISTSAGLDHDIEPIKFNKIGDISDYAGLPVFGPEQDNLFRAGKLLIKINDEWMFCKGLDLINDSTFTFILGATMRGRFHTKADTHKAGDKIFIIDINDFIDSSIGLEFITNSAIIKLKKLFYKIQSVATDSLENPTSESFTPVGLAEIPRGMSHVSGERGRLEYSTTGTAITIWWSVFSDSIEEVPSKYSAGDHPAGQQHIGINSSGGSPHKAFLELRTDPGEVLKKTIDTLKTGGEMISGIDITLTTINIAFNGLPDSFQIWAYLRDVNDSSIKSPYYKITVKKVT